MEAVRVEDLLTDMANDKNQTELKSLNIFGDLQPGDPNVSSSDNLDLFPLLFDIETFFDPDALEQITTNPFAAVIGLSLFGVAQTSLKRMAFTKDHLLITQLGMYIDTKTTAGIQNNTETAPLVGSPAVLKYDPIRQSLGSVWCIDTQHNHQLSEGKKFELSFIRNTLVYNQPLVGPLPEEEPAWVYNPVFNPKKVFNTQGEGAEDVAEQYYVGQAYWLNYMASKDDAVSHPSSPLCESYRNIGMKRVGVTEPTYYSQSDLYDFKGMEQLFVITDDYNGYVGGYGAQSPTTVGGASAKFFKQLAILNLLFTEEQKREGVNLSGIPGYMESMSNVGLPTFVSVPDPDFTADDIRLYNDILPFNKGSAFGGQTINPSLWEEGIQYKGGSFDLITEFYFASVMPPIMNYAFNNIEFNSGKTTEGYKFNFDHSFSSTPAVDANYSYLLPYHPQGNIGVNQPFCAISPQYNFLSIKYEAAMSSYDNILSEKALPNIYMFDKCNAVGSGETSDGMSSAIGLEYGCHEKYNFEKFGSKILDCGKINKIQELNSESNSKKMSNIVINALQSIHTANEVSGMPPELKNSVSEQVDDYPFYVDISFGGDEQDSDKNSRTLFREVEDLNSTSQNISGEEFMGAIHDCGIVHEFIKTIISNQFSGDNALGDTAPSTDPEKLAIFSSTNVAQPSTAPGQTNVSLMDVPNNDIVKGIVPEYSETYVETEDKTIYDFDEWLKIMASDIQNKKLVGPGFNSVLYDKKSLKNSSVDITEPPINKTTQIYEYFYNNSWFTEKFIEFLTTYTLFRNGATRSYKQCVSKTHDKDNNLRYLNSVQGTLFYRIAKYDMLDNLIQNIFIPASSTGNTKIGPPGPPLYKYIDTQVKYGQVYNYKITAYKIVFGTKYRYDLKPYNNNTLPETPINHNLRIDELATKLGFKINEDASEFDALQAPASFGMAPDRFTPVYTHPQFNSVMDRESLYVFSVITEPSVKIIETPFFQDMQVVVLDKPPISPLVNMYPLVGKKNSLLISFENQTGNKEQFPISILESDSNFFALERMHQKRAIKQEIAGREPEFYFPNLQFKSDSFPFAYEVFRLKGAMPSSYVDFAEAEYGRVLVKDATSFVDSISTNVDYYYTFRTVDVHSNISNPSPIYKVRMVEDSGAVYPLINIIPLQEEKKYVDSREFSRFLQIDVADIHKYLNFEKSGLTLDTAINDDKQPYLSVGQDGNPWNNQYEKGPKSAKRFKFRIKSKKTGRVFDLNVGFFVRHEKPNEEANSCTDEVAPFKPGNTQQDPVNKAHTGNADSYFNSGKPGEDMKLT